VRPLRGRSLRRALQVKAGVSPAKVIATRMLSRPAIRTALGALISAVSLSACAEYRAGGLINEAGEKLEAGDNLGAIRVYENAFRLDPTLAAAPYGKGLALRELGRPSEAMSAFRESIRVNPDFIHAHVELARTQVDQRLREEAIETLTEANRRFPSNPDISSQLEHLRFLKQAEGAAK